VRWGEGDDENRLEGDNNLETWCCFIEKIKAFLYLRPRGKTKFEKSGKMRLTLKIRGKEILSNMQLEAG
jgi:hypothetical protein